LPELNTFKAFNNKLSGNLYDLSDMSQLKYIDTGISGNELLSSKSDKIVVTLSNNRLSGTIPCALQKNLGDRRRPLFDAGLE
jgi:hypothetical protein